MGGVDQTQDNDWYYLRGAAKVETTEFLVTADEIDYNSDTHWAYARGNVKFEHFANGEKLNADHAEYNLKTEEGKFYVVDGTSPAKVMNSPGLLTTTNPFYFKSLWAERLKDRYILHQGFRDGLLISQALVDVQRPAFRHHPRKPRRRHTIRCSVCMESRCFTFRVFYRPLGRTSARADF